MTLSGHVSLASFILRQPLSSSLCLDLTFSKRSFQACYVGECSSAWSSLMLPPGLIRCVCFGEE